VSHVRPVSSSRPSSSQLAERRATPPLQARPYIHANDKSGLWQGAAGARNLCTRPVLQPLVPQPVGQAPHDSSLVGSASARHTSHPPSHTGLIPQVPWPGCGAAAGSSPRASHGTRRRSAPTSARVKACCARVMSVEHVEGLRDPESEGDPPHVWARDGSTLARASRVGSATSLPRLWGSSPSLR
jgi:hypothetical protein